MRPFQMNRKTALLLILLMVLSVGLTLSAAAVDLLDSTLGITDSGTTSFTGPTNGVISATVKGGTFSKKTGTITFENKLGKKATIKFDYSASNLGGTSGYLYINNIDYTGGTTSPKGSYTGVMEAGGKFTLTFKSPSGLSGDKIATLSLSNFQLLEYRESNTVTYVFDSTLGSISAGASGTTETIAGGANLNVTATPNSGITFLGWRDPDDGTLYTTSATCTIMPTKDMKLEAVFVNAKTTAPWFRVATNFLFDNMPDACEAAKTAATKVVIPTYSGTLPAGDYTIPSGVTLLIPFDTADTVCLAEPYPGDQPSAVAMHSTASPSAFLTLTLESGTTITCNGNINVGGQRNNTGQPTGMVKGKHGRLVLNGSGTQVTVANGGALYCYGFITGTGQVELNSGGKLHELFQFGDWPGGQNATQWNDYAGDVTSTDLQFMSSRYFVQNVEAPLRINYGASVYCEPIMHVDATLTQIYMTSSTRFIAPYDASNTQGLFLMEAGTYLDRSYSAATDRVTYTLGGAKDSVYRFGAINVQLRDSIKTLLSVAQMRVDMNSGNYTLPLAGNMTVQIADGVILNMDKRVVVMPGAELIVDEGATINLSANTYFYDVAHWIDAMCFGTTKVAPYTAGRGTNTKILDLNRSGRLEVNGTLNITSTGGIFSTVGYTPAGGEKVTSNSSDKIIYGTGTIVNESTVTDPVLLIFNGGNDTSYTIHMANAMAYLAGQHENDDGSLIMTSISIGTYYGLIHDGTNYWYQTKDVVPETCDASGYTIYNTTDGTGLTVAGNPATGHSYASDVTTEATCTTDGLCTCTCSACGDSYTKVIAALGHADKMNANDEEISDHFCDHCKLIMYYATNVRLGNSLDMMFAFPKVFTDEPDTYYIKLVRTYADGATSEQVFSYTNNKWSVTNGYIYITYTGLSAKEMCDKIEVTIYNSQHEAVSVTWVDSIRDYAMRLLDKHEEKKVLLRTLLVDMLNYGAACQDYFGYGKDDPANALLSEAQKDYASTAKEYTATNEDRQGWKVSQLVVESNILYNIVFANTLTYNGQSQNTADLYVRYSYVGHKGNRETISNLEKISDMATVVIDGVTYHYIAVKGMVVADAAKTADDNGTDFAITITITDLVGSTVYAEWTDSIKDYTARNTETHEVYGLFMQFAESAYTYLHTEEARIP